MNRKLIILRIVLLSVLCVALLGVLAVAATRGFSFGGMLRMGELKLAYEETVTPDGLHAINLDFSSMDVHVTVTDEADIRIVQKAASVLNPDEYFTLSNTNGALEINQGRPHAILGFIRIGTYQTLDLYLPRSYAQDLSITTRSGNIDLLSDLSMQNVSLNLSSGELKSGHAIQCNELDVRLMSGDIRLNTVKSNVYGIKSTSGNVVIEALEGTGAVGSTSGNVTIGSITGSKHEVEAFSGDIRINSYKGSGAAHTHSGTITMRVDKLSGDLDLDASSGNIKVSVAPGISFDLLASCSSGDIRGNIDMNYTKNSKTATAKVGIGPYFKLSIGTSSGNISVDQNK